MVSRLRKLMVNPLDSFIGSVTLGVALAVVSAAIFIRSL